MCQVPACHLARATVFVRPALLPRIATDDPRPESPCRGECGESSPDDDSGRELHLLPVAYTLSFLYDRLCVALKPYQQLIVAFVFPLFLSMRSVLFAARTCL